MKFYQAQVRPFLRQLLVSTLPGPVNAKNKIAVVGLPRSGTSWLAKAISLADHVHYYFEPDQVYDKAILYTYPNQAENDKLVSHIIATFRGEIHDEYTIAEQDLSNITGARKASTILVKWVRFPLCLDWIAENFPDIRIVQTVRNPVPLFLSWQLRDWTPEHSLNQLIAQPELMDGPLMDFNKTMRGASTYWEKAGAFWGAVAFMQNASNRPEWILKEHEWYCEDSVTRIRSLVAQLGLNWNSNIEDFLSADRKNESGPGYGKSRDSRTELTKWQGKIDNRELAELRSVVEQFELPFYTDLFSRHPA